MQYKLRTIAKGGEIVGLTTPHDVAQFFSGCYFKVEVIKIGKRYGIFYESGNVIVPDKKELEKIEWSDI